MKGLLAITRREVVERRLVLVAAAAASLVPLLVPLARGLGGDDAAQARGGTALIFSVAFGVGLAAALGLSMLAPRIANRRIAFDFARPVSALAIWAGSGLAACAIAVAAAGIIWVPAALAGAELPWTDLILGSEVPAATPVFLLAALAVVFSLAHALSVMTRSRTALFGVDAALAGATALAFSRIFATLPSFLAAGPRFVLAWGFGIALAAALLLAGLASVARGRVDIRAAHRALSTTLWPGVALALAVAAGYAWWVMSAGPRDLTGGFWATPAQSGSWVQLEGRARGADARFLYDTSSGRFARTLTVDWRGPTFSADGKHAAWTNGQPDGGPIEVLALALNEAAARPRRTRIFLPSQPSILALSADGDRLATEDYGVLSIHELASGRTLTSARVSDGKGDLRGFFVGGDLFRVYASHDSEPTRILELDVAAKKLRTTGQLETPAGGVFIIENRPGDRIVSVAYRGKKAWLCDGRTGARLARLSATDPTTSLSPGFLADGRVVLGERTPEGARLVLFRPDGSLDHAIGLPGRGYIRLGGEAAPGSLVVGLGESGSYSSYLVDLDRAAVRKIGDELWPAARFDSLPSAGSEATRLLTREGFELVRFDPSTSALTVIFRAQSGRPTQ